MTKSPIPKVEEFGMLCHNLSINRAEDETMCHSKCRPRPTTYLSGLVTSCLGAHHKLHLPLCQRVLIDLLDAEGRYQASQQHLGKKKITL